MITKEEWKDYRTRLQRTFEELGYYVKDYSTSYVPVDRIIPNTSSGRFSLEKSFVFDNLSAEVFFDSPNYEGGIQFIMQSDSNDKVYSNNTPITELSIRKLFSHAGGEDSLLEQNIYGSECFFDRFNRIQGAGIIYVDILHTFGAQINRNILYNQQIGLRSQRRIFSLSTV